jgi:hypothetical protein
MSPQELAFWVALYGQRQPVETSTDVMLDEIDTLLAGVEEETADKIMQLAYQLAGTHATN